MGYKSDKNEMSKQRISNKRVERNDFVVENANYR